MVVQVQKGALAAPTVMNASATADAEAIVKQVGIPAQPQVVMDIYKEVKSKNPSFTRISGLISQDPSLAARVLKIINSPFYGRSNKISSVQQAVTMLGLQNFVKVVLTASLREVMAGGSASKKFDGLWKHSVTVGRIAEFVATWMGTEISPEDAYMAGLFHDSAIPLLIKKFKIDDVYFNRESRTEIDSVMANDWIITDEEGACKTNHAIVGGIMSRAWGMSPQISNAIRGHHVRSIHNLDNREGAVFWFTLRLSDYLAEYLAWKSGKPTIEIDFFQDHTYGLNRMGLDQDTLKEIGLDMRSLVDFIEDTMDMMDINMDE
ncbi:MAG: HDOD domain-containing protein [Magnetococcales bacterium]|nr:HDOD domain-containing protein [Magnetococcales bacterium]